MELGTMKKVWITYIILLTAILISCVSPDSPEHHERPYVLTDVKISPHQPAITDTVTLEVIGEGDSTTINEYLWRIGEDPSFLTKSNKVVWVNNNKKDTVQGYVKAYYIDSIEYQGTSNRINFQIIYNIK